MIEHVWSSLFLYASHILLTWSFPLFREHVVVRSDLSPPFSRAAEGDAWYCLLSYVFPVLCDSRVHVLHSPFHSPVCFRSRSTHPPPFPLFGSRELLWFRVLAVPLPFCSSRHGHAKHLHPWIASAAAVSPLTLGMSVRGGREGKEGPKEGDDRSSDGGEGGGGKMQHRVNPYCCWWGGVWGGWMLTSVFYIQDLHTPPNHLRDFSLSHTHTCTHTFVLLTCLCTWHV